MNIKTFALLGGALLLAGCPGEEPTDTPTDVPTETGNDMTDMTDDTDPPPPPPAFEWHVVLTDGDQVDDAVNGQLDGDTIATDTANSVANYPHVVEWDFGMAATESEAASPGAGWFGEDCDGLVTQGQDICHTMLPDTTMTLSTVAEINQIVPGSSTLFDIDYPEENTPELTYVIYGVDGADQELVCLRMGHQPAYYNGPGCEDFVAPM